MIDRSTSTSQTSRRLPPFPDEPDAREAETDQPAVEQQSVHRFGEFRIPDGVRVKGFDQFYPQP